MRLSPKMIPLVLLALGPTSSRANGCQVENATELPARGVYKRVAPGRVSPTERTRFKEFGTLPRDFAPQLVGADLLRTHLAETRIETPVKIGVLDGSFALSCLNQAARIKETNRLYSMDRNLACNGNYLDGHGVSVHNIISHPEFGSEATGRAEYALYDHRNANQGGGLRRSGVAREVADFFVRARARVVNFSGRTLGDENESGEHEAFRSMRSRGVIFVQSSGNMGPGPVEDSALRNGGITVGSVDADGEASSFCNCEGAFVSAPSGDHIQAVLPSGEAHRFGGTSGAAPVVTGLIATLLAVAPGLGEEEVKLLMEKTALPLGGAPPLVNGLKMVLAGEEIQKACRGQGNFKACARREIAAGTVMNFSVRAAAFAARAEGLAGEGSCRSLQLAAKMARFAFLLEPKAPTAQMVARIYQRLGSPVMASLYLRSAGLPVPPTALKQAESGISGTK